jgi:hypothetical protein
MADDDEIMEPEEEFEVDEEADIVEIDPEELDEDELDEDVLVAGDDDAFGEDDDILVGDDEEEEDDDTSGPVRRSVTSEDEDEDEDMLAPDDVEADLDTILKDRLVAEQDEDENEEEEPEEKGEAADRLQPKRADERLCPSCFLLVRQSAPGCPVGDDDCPLFSK